MCTSTCRKWKRPTMEQNNDSLSFQRFLNEFCDKLKEKADDENIVPLRFANPRVTRKELEGECLEWCLNFLSTRNCPVILAAALAHETYLQVSSCNLDDTLTDYASSKEGSNHESLDNNGDEEKENKNGESEEEMEDKVQEYNATQLQKFVIGTLESVCKTWAEDPPCFTAPNKLLEMSFHAIKNTRRKMEDSHAFVHDLNTLFGLEDQPEQSYYAVFDGHAGMDAAIFAAKHLHCLLTQKCDLDSDPGEALRSAFKVTDEAFIQKAKREKWRSGTTGVAALVRGSKLHMAWLGDSQGVLVRDGQAVTHMEPHKPDRQDERDRIESEGGFVMMMGDLWRVGGNIAVSRAIGDVNYKPFISSDAEVISTDLNGTEDYLVLACDGAWDVIMPDDLPRLVYDHLIETNFDRASVANMLVRHAKNNGSTDNISVIVVFFRENISEPKSVNLFNFGSFSQGDADEDCKERDVGGDDTRGGNSGSSQNGRGDDSMSGRKKGEVNENSDPMDYLDSDNEFGMKVDNDQGPKYNEIDLDYYGVLDTRLTDDPAVLSARDIPNSSELLKNIAETMYSSRYGYHERTQPVRDYRINHHSKTYQGPYVTKAREVFPHHKKVRRDDPNNGQKKPYNTKGLATSPIIWSFTGRNKASVQNHRLIQAAKTSTRASLNMSESKLGIKSLAEKNPRLTQSWPSIPMAENLQQPSTGNVFLSQGKCYDYVTPPTSNRNTSTTTIGQPSLTVFGSKTDVKIEVESKKFRSTWRPRKPLKPVTAIVYDAPPTPFMNNKLHGAK